MKPTRPLRAAVLAAGAALVLAVATVGPSLAQTAAPTPPAQAAQGAPDRRERVLQALADKLGVSVERLKQAIQEVRAEVKARARQQVAERFRANLRQTAAIAAQAIGISPEQLRQELPGKSLADVAKAHGVDPRAVQQALTGAAHQRIDTAAAEGKLPAEHVDRLKERVAQAIERLMTRTMPARPSR
jgi:uncharacterized protein YidB (DUF937 family)